jgi:5-hydroxyisourate hydrolase-like protein (transthyretin family)
MQRPHVAPSRLATAAVFSHYIFKRSFFMSRILFSLTLFCTLFSVSGCKDSSRPEDLPKLFPCVITITQEGKPLEEASVELVATDQNNTKYKSLSITDAEGKAVMSTYGHEGVPAGKYKVAVTKILHDDLVYGTNSSGEREVVDYKAYKTVEPRFSEAKTTPHELEITGKDKKNEVTFDTGKAIKVRM